ncbi:MAG: type III pantothenate kinase [Oscillospiraceae bacterium]|nr:type III pantothenate kinase [Oscillospiraceae bacterium]
MILTIDIGNSNITIGAYRDDQEQRLFLSRIGTDRKKMPDEYAIMINSILRLHGHRAEDLDGAIISSVVPPLSASLKSAIRRLKDIRILTVGPGIKTGLNILLDNPAQLGADLACVSVAAMDKYPLPSIVLDMGTATTISALDRSGNFLGGSIIPGVRISLEALTARTAQLPQIELDHPPQSVIGSNTIDSMKSGVMYGTAGMIDGMIRRYRAQLGDDLTVIATGGLAPAIVCLCENKVILDEDLLLDGLYLLYRKNTK